MKVWNALAVPKFSNPIVATKLPIRKAKSPYISGPKTRAIITVVTKANPARKRLARTLTAKRDDIERLVKSICVGVVKVKKLPLTFQ